MAKHLLLFRSGRHLNIAVRALRELWPDCRLLVVSQPGTEPILDQLGIAVEDRFFYEAGKFFSPVAVALSAAGRAIRKRVVDDVVVLWADPEGKGYSNVNRTALLFSPRGFLAITPDGSVHQQHTMQVIVRETQRAFCSVVTLALLNLLLYIPAAVLRTFKR